MHGIHQLIVQSTYLKYEMTFFRNITILKGDSATGKTTLVDMIQEYNQNGSDTGIMLSCDCPCRVIAGNNWKEQLGLIQQSIVFIDEGNRFIASEDFARTIRETDNYYVLITREALDNLPYSVTEIYGIRSSGKYASLTPVYHHMYRIYGTLIEQQLQERHSLLVEDSKAGFEFFSAIAKKKGLECCSDYGAGNVFSALSETSIQNSVMVIADGAAFGAQMEKVSQLMERHTGIQLYLPESFEWILLASDFLNDREVRNILDASADYIESREYFSWECYYTWLLMEKTKDTYMQYTKTRLNSFYLHEHICKKILSVLPEALREILSLDCEEKK